jgi:hypothetical protein
MNTIRRHLADIIIFLTILTLLTIIGALQKKYENLVSPQAAPSMNYLPSGAFLKGIALGYDEAFADFLWVRAVGYFGAHVKSDRDFTWLTHMLRLITTLDPRYESPYEFAGIILPSELGLRDEGIAFLEKGVSAVPKHNPRYWLQPFYLGYSYMLYKNDAIKAAKYMEIAARYPRSPKYLPLLASRLYANAEKPEIGMEILQSLLNKSGKDMQQNSYWRNAIEKRMNELIAAKYIDLLNHAVHQYRSLYGQAPSQLEDLVSGLILPFIPEEPFGGGYYLSVGGKEVFSTRTKGKLRVHADNTNLDDWGFHPPK